LNTFKKVWSLLTHQQRIGAFFLIAATLLGAILESLSIGLIVPLIKLISNPSSLEGYPWVMRVTRYFGIVNPHDIMEWCLYIFITVFISKSVYVIKMTHFHLTFTGKILYSLSSRLLEIYLYMPWTFHLQRNTADLLNNITTQVGQLCTGMIGAMLRLCTDIFFVTCILILLVLIDPISTFLAALLLGTSNLVFFYFVRRKLRHFGADNKKYSTEMMKCVNEAFGGFKETKVLGREEHFVGSYQDSNRGYVKSWIYVTFVSKLQKICTESIFVTVIAAISLIALGRGESGTDLLSTLALFAACAFRLMPAVNGINGAITQIKYHEPILEIICRDINASTDGRGNGDISNQLVPSPLSLEEGINLKDVFFRYGGSKQYVLDSLNMFVPKGQSVGFMGPSGVGKTTTADIILGLLKPSSGEVLSDGRNVHRNLDAWQQMIGYIPQNIYLSDNTFRRNVAFGLEDVQIDDEKVWAAAKKAQLYDLIKELPEGLDTFVGEHGLRLSGGQRQRIGIARALYHDPEVLVMDEATSSLDKETEREITRAINMLSGEKTMIIIAHRETTVEKCDIKYYFKNGKAKVSTISTM